MPEVSKFIGPDMVFLIAGYDQEPYGKVFEVQIPRNPIPKEWHKDGFGPVWGGQQEIVSRLLHGYDNAALQIIQNLFSASTDQITLLNKQFTENIEMRIPYPFLALQDCIDLSILLIKTTIQLQSFYVGLRGVGGNIDVATITKTGGFKPYQEKVVAKLYRREQI
jgi:hypothetical protein